MGRLSARSNPTDIKEIDRKRVGVFISETNGLRTFTLERLDLDGLKLSPELQLICIAVAGPASLRFDLGSVASWSRTSQSLDALDRCTPLRFRILLHEQGNPRLVASAENIRPIDGAQSESLLPMEPAELGERLWRLEFRDEGPVLQFNVGVFPSAAGVENYLPFNALVLPEALYEVIKYLSADPEKLSDENDPWSAWGAWLDAIGADRPPIADDEEARETWCQDTLQIFCNRHKFASAMHQLLRQGEQE